MDRNDFGALLLGTILAVLFAISLQVGWWH